MLSYVAKPSMSRGRSKLPISEIRKRMLHMDKRWIIWPESLISKKIALSSSHLLAYQFKTNNTQNDVVFYVRGGGFCFKTPNAHAKFIANIMHHCQLDAFIPDYRLAPEHPYPAALNDVIEGYQKLIELKPDANIVLMGDSAGGNLAAALLLEIKRQGLPQPKSTVLLSPALDIALLGNVEQTLAADDPLFTIESLLRLRGAYLNGQNPMLDSVSPLQGDFSDLSPVMIIAGTRELLLQDAKQLVKKIQDCEGRVQGLFYPNMPHVFPLFEMLPEATQARHEIHQFIQLNMKS